ncbi:MAG: adhesin, partial [Chloroflexia bacterium]|nr:adhesin [Chloroflexia bacterium]
GDPLTFSVVSSPSQGLLAGPPPSLTYTPAADYYGADVLSFVASDGLTTSAPAVVDISVLPLNDAPIAYSQALTTAQGHTVAITLSGSDIESRALTYHIIAGPGHGTLVGTAPNLAYVPVRGYNGCDSLLFIVNDGELDSAPALVSITIRAVVYLPVVIK